MLKETNIIDRVDFDPHISEAQIQQAIVAYLEMAIGAIVIRTNAGLAFSMGGKHRILLAAPGTPDLVAMLPEGRVLHIEVKSAKGRLSPAQVEMHERLKKLGHTVVIARCIDDVVRVIERGKDGN